MASKHSVLRICFAVLCCSPLVDTAASGSAAGKDAAKQPAPMHPLQVEQLNNKRKLRNMLIWGSILLCIVVPAVVGPVYYTQVQLPRDRAAAEAAARAAIKPPVPPLPPLVPITEVSRSQQSNSDTQCTHMSVLFARCLRCYLSHILILLFNS